MLSYVIEGGRKLEGELDVSGIIYWILLLLNFEWNLN